MMYRELGFFAHARWTSASRDHTFNGCCRGPLADPTRCQVVMNGAAGCPYNPEVAGSNFDLERAIRAAPKAHR